MKTYQLIIFYVICNTLEANEISKNAKLYTAEGYLSERCSDILEEFAQNAANFTLCSITKAKPIKLCENCIYDYVKFTTKYKELDTMVNGTSCRSLYTSQDRFEVVLEYYEHIMAVWDKGHCNDCFDLSGESPILSNNTKKFNSMAKDTKDCIKSNIDPNANNSDVVCNKCMQSYLRLNEFYSTLSKDSIGVDSVCMDIVDLMNTTRAIWSKTLNCCKLRKSPEIVFLCSTAIISLLPLMYYLVIRYYGPIRDLPNVLKQSRFHQSFLSSTHGRIN